MTERSRKLTVQSRKRGVEEVCAWLTEVGETQLCSRIRERWVWYQLYGPDSDRGSEPEAEEVEPPDIDR